MTCLFLLFLLTKLNAAQMRAVLNLSNHQQGLSEAYYLQAAQEQQQRQLQQQRQHQLLLQQRQQQQQQQQLLQQQQHLRQQEIRDIQLRQLLLQEQLSHQRQELQLRAIGDQLQDFPDLQQHYQNILIDDRLQRQHQNTTAVSGLVSASNDIVSSVQQQQQAAQLRDREQQLRAYKEQILLQQQLQQQPLISSARPDDVVPSNTGRALQTPLLLPVLAAKLPPSLQQFDGIQRQASSSAYSQNNLDIMDVSASRSANIGASTSAGRHLLNYDDDQSFEGSVEEEIKPQKSRKRSHTDRGIEGRRLKHHIPKKQKSKNQKHVPARKNLNRGDSWRSESPSLCDSNEYQTENVMDTLACAADLVYEDFQSKGSFTDLLEAAEENEHMESAAMILVDEIADVQPWPMSEDEKDEAGDDYESSSIARLKIPATPAEQVSLHSFKSAIPNLPEEPLIEDDVVILEIDEDDSSKKEEDNRTEELELEAPKQTLKMKKSSINEYPYPIDTWWPSIGGMRRERKSCGETTDEDAFEDEPTPSGEKGVFRANRQKIKCRLSKLVQPGVLEKLPHCKIHRIKSRRKKNSNSPELAYCWQVTELYPNDVMVNCSVCGTWRHICCGGHYKSYSVREHTKAPFVAVCENCHEEDQFLKDYPRGAKRVERQRAEQLRRGLATSTVMRYASYSKHGGTYKWPLGSVSATHIAGHTRSVQARHDKGEKQWNDMASRLYRGHGYRAKERVRSRTKELERLLVAVEDAEGYTDRHNMFVFLQRDTAKAKPAGFETEMKNIFDPADDADYDVDQPVLWDILEAPVVGKKNQSFDEDDQTQQSSNKSMASPLSVPALNNECVRIGCNRSRRFDSRFCSDACGVSTVEVSLMHAIQDASVLHPAVLRHG